MNRVEIKPEMLRWACKRTRIEPIALAERIPQLPLGDTTRSSRCSGSLKPSRRRHIRPSVSYSCRSRRKTGFPLQIFAPLPMSQSVVRTLICSIRSTCAAPSSAEPRFRPSGGKSRAGIRRLRSSNRRCRSGGCTYPRGTLRGLSSCTPTSGATPDRRGLGYRLPKAECLASLDREHNRDP